MTSKIDWSLKHQSKKLKTSSISKYLDEGKIEVLNKHLEKKISSHNQTMMKPFNFVEDEEDEEVLGGSLLKSSYQNVMSSD